MSRGDVSSDSAAHSDARRAKCVKHCPTTTDNHELPCVADEDMTHIAWIRQYSFRGEQHQHMTAN